MDEIDGGQSPIPGIDLDRFDLFLKGEAKGLIRASLDGRDVTVIVAVLDGTSDGPELVTAPMAIMLDEGQLARLVPPAGAREVGRHAGPQITA